ARLASGSRAGLAVACRPSAPLGGSPAATFLPRPPAPLQRNFFGGDRHETRVRPEFEPSALAPATFSVRRSSASIDGHRLCLSQQARRQYPPTGRVRKGVADEDSRPIIGLATVSPTNSIVLCRGRRARLGAHHTKG